MTDDEGDETELAADGAGEAYTVEFVNEGEEIQCPADEYILNAAEDAEIQLPYSCLQGVCAACSARVEGEVDQSEQMILSQYEKDQGYVMLCVAYPRSDLKVYSREEP